MRTGKWSVSPFALVVLVLFLAAVGLAVFASDPLAAVGVIVALLILLAFAADLVAGPATNRRLNVLRRAPGDRPSYGYGVTSNGYADPDDGSDAQYIAQAGTPSDEAWQRERALVEDKQAHPGDS